MSSLRRSPRVRGGRKDVSEGWEGWVGLSEEPSKRAAERFNLIFSGVWLAVFVAIVASQAYFHFGDAAFMALGLFVALPYLVWPVLFPFAADRRLPWHRRYFVVSNIWIAVLSYVGNYFWTHYFYVVLGAAYHFPVKIELNGVPFFLYLVTHGYFMFYHTLTTILLRHFYRSSWGRSLIATGLLVFLMAVVTAFMETWTISNVPYYTHRDKWAMYTVGSVVYGIYFIVSFPMFFRVGEERTWTSSEALIDAGAACMLVTCLLDLWRLVVGTGGAGLPWMPQA